MSARETTAQSAGDRTASANLNLAQAAGTYDALTCSGGAVEILDVAYVVTTAAATLTSVAVVNDHATATTFLSAVNGALANLVAQANLVPYVGPNVLLSGKKLQYTIVGATGTGVVRMVVRWRAVDAGAVLA